ncbi:hypothetical protein [Variovorax rhizosphaerae]|uniref:Fibronectin type-III domain-containing protein n=1 Tax=Variovorax rhizosphaerae TaxID=1836200 RepID=A0ABU8WLB3_9BURK
MDLTTLKQALQPVDGRVTIAKSGFPGLANLIDECYGGQSIVIDEVLSPSDGADGPVIRDGRMSFLGQPATPVTATFSLVSGAVQATLRHTLPVVAGWKFSDIFPFPDLPDVHDWRKTGEKPRTIPLDDLQFASAALHVTNLAQLVGEVALRPGINFVGQVALAGQTPAGGVTGAIHTTFGVVGAELTLFGTIRFPREQAEALASPDALWDGAPGRPVPPGILLQARLGRSLALGAQAGGLKFGDVCFRLYSPLSIAWLEDNPSYAPLLAYTGALELPNAGLPAGLAITARQQLGANELLFTGRFANASVANLTRLDDLFGSKDVHGAMGVLGEAIGKLELMSATLAVDMKEKGGVDLTNASVTLGFPDLHWQVFDDILEIESIAAQVDVPRPFGASPTDSMSRFRGERLDVTVHGRARIFRKAFVFTGTTRDPFTLHARLAQDETLSLSDVLATWPGSLPALRQDVVIDYLAFDARHSRTGANTFAFAARVRAEPKLEIAAGLALSEVVVQLTATSEPPYGAISALLTLAGTDLHLETRKSGDTWRFIGALASERTIDFQALVKERVDPGLDLPSVQGFPRTLTLKTAEASLELPDGVFDFTGAADIDWPFAIGSASFTLKSLKGSVHLEDGPGGKWGSVSGAIRFAGMEGTGTMRLGSGVDEIVTVQVKTLASPHAFSVRSAFDGVGEGARFAKIVPAEMVQRLPRISGFSASMNLTKQVYLVEGSLEGFGWAWFLYHGIDGVGAAPARGTYLFAAGLGAGFRFQRLMPSLAAIDELLTVQDAMLCIYSVDGADHATGFTTMRTLASTLVKQSGVGWPLTDATAGELVDDRGLLLTATLGVPNVFGKDYNFRGSLLVTSQLMRGQLAAWASPASGSAAQRISNPFSLPGLEIEELQLQATQSLDEPRPAPTLTLLGRVRIGRLPVAGAADKRALFVAKLGLAQGKPALMAIALDSDLDVGAFLAQCFTGDGAKWPSGFVDLAFKAGSRIYYLADLPGAALWQDEPAHPYEPGFNVEARAELALGSAMIPFRFTFRSKLDSSGRPVGFLATGGLDAPVELGCLSLASDQHVGHAYVAGPAVRIDMTDAKQPQFGLVAGLNFFGRAIVSADFRLSRTPTGATLLDGRVRSAESLGVFGKLSFGFRYLRSADGRRQTLAIEDWSMFKLPEQLIDIVATIKQLADASEGVGCGDLAAYLLEQTMSTTFGVTPTISGDTGAPVFSVRLTCAMHLGGVDGPVLMEWDPVTVPIPLPKDTTFDELADCVRRGISGAASVIVQALLKQPDKVAMFLALTFGPKAAAYAVDLLCRRLRMPGGGVQPIIAPAVPTLVGSAWGSIVAAGGAAVLTAAAVLGILAALIKKAQESGDSPPPPAKPDELATPALVRFDYDGSALQAEWKAVAFAGSYEVEVMGPVPVVTRVTGVTAATTATAGGALVAAPYRCRVRARRGEAQGPWSATLTCRLEQLIAPPLRLALAGLADARQLEAAWAQLPGGPWTLDLELLRDGTPVDTLRAIPGEVTMKQWPVDGLAAGRYTVRLAVRGAAPNHLASGWSAPSSVVVKLAPPVVQALRFDNAADGGKDNLRATWQWPGDVAGVAFEARLVVDGVAVPDVPNRAAATGAEFDPANLAVQTYRVIARAHAEPASPGFAFTAASDWSAPSDCAIAKLAVPQSLDVRAGAHEASVDVSIGVVGAGADAFHARLFRTGGAASRVEAAAGAVATLLLDDDYHGPAQVGVRSARRDGTAIASDWVKRDIVRLAPPSEAFCRYDRAGARLEVQAWSPDPMADPTPCELELQVFAGVEPVRPGSARMIPPGGQPAIGDIAVSVLPPGPLQVRVRACDAAPALRFASAWRVIPQTLHKLDKAVVANLAFHLASGRVRIAFGNPGLDRTVIREATFGDPADGAIGSASGPEIECPEPFGAGNHGSRLVQTRLASTAPEVINGDWLAAESAWTLTKFAPPTGVSLAWDEAADKFSMDFKAAAGSGTYEAQALVDGQPWGDIMPCAPGARHIAFDHIPSACAIAVRVRSTGPAPRTVRGDWVTSAALARGGVNVAQPTLHYTPGQDVIEVEWAAAGSAMRLAAQVLSEGTKPVGGVAVADAPAGTPVRASLRFGDLLEPGEVRVRYRTLPTNASQAPGVWTTSTATLARLLPASRLLQSSYVDGTLTLQLEVEVHLRRHPFSPPSAFALGFYTGRPGSVVPMVRAGANADDPWRATLAFSSEQLPSLPHAARVVTVGEIDRTIDGRPVELASTLRALERPVITRLHYEHGELAVWLADMSAQPAFPPSGMVRPYRLRIDSGNGTAKTLDLQPSMSRSGVCIKLEVDMLAGLPAASTWTVSAQQLGVYAPFETYLIGSGPWSAPVKVLAAEPVSRRLGPSRGQDGTRFTQPESAFDDIELVQELKLPLTEIVVYMMDFYVCALEACYGHGEQRKVLLRGATTYRSTSERIQVPPGGITRISGCAAKRGRAMWDMRVCGMAFFTAQSGQPFAQVGHVNAGSADTPFSFDALPGEAILAFFGWTYAGSQAEMDELGTGFLGSLGAWACKAASEPMN